MKYAIILFVFLYATILSAQDDLLKELDSLEPKQADITTATFKTTRIVTGHSIERMKEGQLEFRISHRFGKLNSGFDNYFGLDQSIIFMSLEYGITDWLEAGIGRTPNEKIIHGFTKLSLFRQSTGKGAFPISISYLGAMDVSTQKWDNPNQNNYFSSRLSYVHQLMFARKFTDAFSVQLSPTLIHRNLVPTELDDNDVFAVGIGGRYKLSNRISFNVEYFYSLRAPNIKSIYSNPISVGFDIETGGHVFQIMVTNSIGMIEKHYIAENTGDVNRGDIHLGFNISRVFTLFGD